MICGLETLVVQYSPPTSAVSTFSIPLAKYALIDRVYNFTNSPIHHLALRIAPPHYDI